MFGRDCIPGSFCLFFFVTKHIKFFLLAARNLDAVRQDAYESHAKELQTAPIRLRISG